MTRLSDEQLGYMLQRVSFLRHADPGPCGSLRRIVDALVELHCRRSDADYHNALRPPDPDASVHGTRDPDEPQWHRALHPLAETTDARNAHKAGADKLTHLAKELEAILGWGPPVRGHRDRRGRLQIESVGPDGERRIG